MAEAPDGLELFVGERRGFLDVDEAAEAFHLIMALRHGCDSRSGSHI
jgi:hypothetical protein